MNPMTSAPRDGSRILLKYTILHWFNPTPKNNFEGGYIADGEKWEECRWFPASPTAAPRFQNFGSWSPWCGQEDVFTTLHIKESQALGWLPLPEED